MNKLKILTILLCITFSARSQTITNLVMEGGGVKGMAYPGALIELEKVGVLDSVQRVAGTSSGGLNALLLCVGYKPAEIKQIIMEMKVHKLNQRGIPVVGPWRRMNHKFGWFSSERVNDMLEELVANKAGNKDLTFQMLYDSARSNPAKYKQLYLTGTDLVNQTSIVFSHENYPDMRVVDAGRVTMTIPLYFEAIFIDPSGKVLANKSKMDSTTRIMVDGGLKMNYPIHVFDSVVSSNPHPEYAPNPHTLGLKLEDDKQIDYNIRGAGLAPFRIRKITEFIGAFYNVSFEGMNRTNLDQDDWNRTIFITTSDISSRIRHMPDEEKIILMNNAAAAVQKFYTTSGR